MADGGSVSRRSVWRKVLFEKQEYADNYVDASFLQEMRKNVSTETYGLNYLVWHSGVVSQQISSVAIFAVVFALLDMEYLHPTTLFLLTAILSGFAALFLVSVDSTSSIGDLKTCVIFTVALYGLSPVLKTLTESISTDTIYAMTTFMLLVHLLFHNYGAEGAMVSHAISLNSATFASVCLASRLPTVWHVFVTILFAISLFALGPLTRLKLKMWRPSFDFVSTALLGVVSTVAVFSLSTSLTVLLAIAHVAVIFLCPLWLFRLQKLKNTIHGPWDEAVITE
ncbi:phosphatidylinositol N-acetylglucosaminyltransferase subunit C-like [Corticium candelabrum]|uniref:phosphatidylinositol N-acetylglucosaminyltransferase subunit C-like n=1 Tax=Corticium candelabrum TaxID=121492 RepID=UPI002E260434|nr:phosphatidylinositol N-acetylglucosaminyltransferase subunit C-like [Corticium candelabrum]